MINGGNTTLYVADFNRSVDFYTETLGLKLSMRASDHWAEIDAGPGVMIGLHPVVPGKTAEAGTVGSMAIGFNVTEPLEDVMATLTERGVVFPAPIVEDEFVRFAYFADPDGNPLYITQVLYHGAHGAPE